MKLKFITKADHLTALAKKVFNGIEPIDDCHARLVYEPRLLPDNLPVPDREGNDPGS